MTLRVLLQMSILDGNLYDTRFQEAGQELDDDLEASQLLQNNRQQPLLGPGGVGQHTSTGKVLVQLSVRPFSCAAERAAAASQLLGRPALSWPPVTRASTAVQPLDLRLQGLQAF